MNFLPSNYKNGKVLIPQRPKQTMRGGFIANDISLAKTASNNIFDRQEKNSKLQNIGSTVSRMNEKTKEKQNLVF